jgi:hypothetical protein
MEAEAPGVNVNVELPDVEVGGEATTTAPASLADQIDKVVAELRSVRGQMAILAERKTVLTDTATRLYAEARLHRKTEDFLKSLSPAEREQLKNRFAK